MFGADFGHGTKNPKNVWWPIWGGGAAQCQFGSIWGQFGANTLPKSTPPPQNTPQNHPTVALEVSPPPWALPNFVYWQGGFIIGRGNAFWGGGGWGGFIIGG